MKNSLTIQQSLYGYDQGHQCLASSLAARLPGKTEKLLLKLSDVRASSIPNSGFVFTAYPLDEIEHYALIKTWAAPELERPGCVWSHVLFISFPDIGKIRCLKEIESIMPAYPITNHAIFSTPIMFDSSGYSDNTPNQKEIRTLVSLLFSTQMEQISVEYSSTVLDSLLKMWDFFWPKLRRSFSFRTHDGVSDITFDLVATNKKNIDETSHPEQEESWVRDSVSSITQEQSELKSFMWTYGVLAINPRASFKHLAKFFSLHDFRTFPTLVKLGEWKNFPNEIKSVLVKEYLEENHVKTASSLKEAIDAAFKLNDNLPPTLSSTIAEYVENFTNEDLFELIRGNSKFKNDLFQFITSYKKEASPYLAARNEEYLSHCFSNDLEVTSDPNFWSNLNSFSETLKSYLTTHEDDFRKSLALSLNLKLRNTSQDFFSINPEVFETIVLSYFVSDNNSEFEAWLKLIPKNSMGLLTYLEQNRHPNRALLKYISEVIPPDLSGNNDNNDSWLSALRRSEIPLNLKSKGIVLFSFSRGYKLQNNELLFLSFDLVRKWVNQQKLTQKDWEFVKRHVVYRETIGFFEAIFQTDSRQKSLDKVMVEYLNKNRLAPEKISKNKTFFRRANR